MSEYLVKVKITAAGTYSIPIKDSVRGVYSTTAIKIAWDYNGEIADITPTAATVWEPYNPFKPGPISKLVFTATAATDITIRME